MYILTCSLSSTTYLHPPTYLTTNIPTYLPTYLPTHLPTYPLTYLPTLPTHPLTCLSTNLHFPVPLEERVRAEELAAKVAAEKKAGDE